MRTEGKGKEDKIKKSLSKKPVIKIIILIFVFTIAIPIVINESYKHRVIYVTKWDASDVLGYYGTLLATTTTVVALVGTIQFTRKQIQHDQFLEENRTKWEKVESIIIQALVDISPLKIKSAYEIDISNIDMDVDKPYSSLIVNYTIILRLQSYATTAKTSLDMISCYISPVEHEQITDYVRELHSAINQFCAIEYELEMQYINMQMIRTTNNGKIPNDLLLICYSQISKIQKKIPIAHDETYQQLLNMKREVFSRIYAELEVEANQILRFWQKRG